MAFWELISKLAGDASKTIIDVATAVPDVVEPASGSGLGLGAILAICIVAIAGLMLWFSRSG